jgi:hypothetical protein
LNLVLFQTLLYYIIMVFHDFQRCYCRRGNTILYPTFAEIRVLTLRVL